LEEVEVQCGQDQMQRMAHPLELGFSTCFDRRWFFNVKGLGHTEWM